MRPQSSYHDPHLSNRIKVFQRMDSRSRSSCSFLSHLDIAIRMCEHVMHGDDCRLDVSIQITQGYFVSSRPPDVSRYSFLSAGPIAPSACEGGPNGPSCIECPHRTDRIQFRKCLDENSDNILGIVVPRVDEDQIDHRANCRERCCLEG